jgi:N-acetylglucosaminyl-diphospho-decaprenol L-rhamnosyltransferase
MSDPKLTIVIVSWNTRDLLARCLASVLEDARELPRVKVEVCVVDNASTDGSPEAVRERFPSVRLIENRENVGFARANNQAIQATTGAYVLLLNPDTELVPGALEALVRFVDGHPRAGAAGARLVHPDGTLQPSCCPSPTLSRELWRLFHLDALWPYACYRMAAWDRERPREVDVVQGACLMLRREAVYQVGLLDEDYFIYSEEVDLCRRLRQHGWNVHWVPQAIVVHHGGQSTRQVPATMFLRLYQSKILYFRKHQGRLAASLYKLILLAAAVARLMLACWAWLERPPKRQEHLILARYYRRLVTAVPWL